MSEPPCPKKSKISSGPSLAVPVTPIPDVGVSPKKCPPLPPECWGIVLDHLPYSDVRFALLTCRSIATDAPARVSVLHIHAPSELSVPAGRRFPNVAEINVLCLLRHVDAHEHHLIADTAARVVPFVVQYPKLRKLFVGGGSGLSLHGRKLTQQPYSPTITTHPEDHLELFRGMVMAFAGALKAGALSQDLDVKGLVHRYHTVKWRCPNTSVDRAEPLGKPCRLCRQICEAFPLKSVIGLQYMYSNPRDKWLEPMHIEPADLCIRQKDYYDIIRSRAGGISFLQSEAGTRKIVGILGTMAERHYVRHLPDPDECHDANDSPVPDCFYETMQVPPSVLYIEEDALDYLKRSIEPEFRMGKIAEEIIQEELDESTTRGRDMNPEANRSIDIWERSVFERLVAMGFPLSDCAVVDRDEVPCEGDCGITCGIHHRS